MARKQSLEMQDRTWERSEKGCWSLSLGERGCRVRVAQRIPGGTFFRVTWITGQGRSQASLQTKRRTEARKRAEAFLRELEAQEEAVPVAPLTLEGLWNRYQQEARRYRRNTEKTRKAKQRTVEFLYAGFGRQKRVEDLCPHDVECYIEARENGLVLEDGGQLRAVGARAIESDLQLLMTMLNWATTVKTNGEWLLKENPLRGIELPTELNPRRPLTTYDRFLRTIDAVQRLAAGAPQRTGKKKWLRIELALVLAESTGRRLGSVRGLRWSDWDFDRRTVRWRKEFDKGRYEKEVGLPCELAERVKSLKLQLEAFGDGWLFPMENKDEPQPRAMFDQALRQAEREAGLPKLNGSLWHAYRRKWATEKKPFPEADVMAAGGWRDVRTFRTCYQQADEETILAVMEYPKKLMAKEITVSA